MSDTPDRRAVRRHHVKRIKKNVRRFLRDVWRFPYRRSLDEITPKRVAHFAETHCRPCSCDGCKRLGGSHAKGNELLGKASDQRRALGAEEVDYE